MLEKISDTGAVAVILALSAGVAALVLWLTYGAQPGVTPEWAQGLPAFNAACNFLSACCLATGVWMIRHGRREAHIRAMASALILTLLFLAGYLSYHYFAGDTKYGGQGWIRPVYFFILITHVTLSIVNFPMAASVVFFALTGRFERHKPLARICFPVWIYVSVTGVAVYFFLLPWR